MKHQLSPPRALRTTLLPTRDASLQLHLAATRVEFFRWVAATARLVKTTRTSRSGGASQSSQSGSSLPMSSLSMGSISTLTVRERPISCQEAWSSQRKSSSMLVRLVAQSWRLARIERSHSIAFIVPTGLRYREPLSVMMCDSEM